LIERPVQAIRPGVSAVIFDDAGRVLLQQRTDNGNWGLPGGAVEFGESVLEALHREVREETGLTITVERLVGVYSHPEHHQIVTYPDGNVIHFVSTCFACRPTGGTLTLGDETAGLAWFEASRWPATLMPIHRLRIDDALAHAALPFVR
jgi:ADP-ribose pyrophosphatase YjhB (NUDIX family)